VILGREVDSFLYLASAFGASPPQEDAATYAAALARFCALALSSLRRRRLEDQQRTLYRELDQARSVQQRFMPPEHGVAGPLRFAMHSRPGRFVAGDICGIRDLDGSRAVAFIGDVSGKGMGPALLMTSLQSFLDAAASDVEAGLLATRASAHFARYATESRFATLWLCRADASKLELDCVDAGHGLVVHMRGGTPERMTSTAGGPPLGVVDAQIYESSVMRLEPGERVVIVTDGVTEQRNADDEQFGNERLLQSLTGSSSPEEDVARIVGDLMRFAATQDYADDVTVVSLAFV
jgi:serine phosphatase RsbU (regulator of sigma subunit)